MILRRFVSASGFSEQVLFKQPENPLFRRNATCSA